MVFVIVGFFCVQCFSSTVAIIDTGADIQHPLLQKNLWTNPKEIPGNGIDEDQNGYIDDIHGWNFIENSANIQDHHGHGTHIAGIIAKNSPNVKLMILKYFDPKASPAKNLQSTIEAIQYATKMKAQIINYSAGGPGYNSIEEAAIRKAQEANILMVAAAGNDATNTDIVKYYPANYKLSNILSVLALSSKNKLASFSNFGPESIDIATLGEDILSSSPHQQFVKMSGTSQATAFITSAAANLRDQYPDWQVEELSSALKQSGDALQSLVGKSKYEKAFDPSLLASIRSSRESAFGEVWTNMDNIPLEQILLPEP